MGYSKSKDNGIDETGPGRACSVSSLPEDKVGVDVHVYLPINNADRYVKMCERQTEDQKNVCLFPNTRCIECETIGALRATFHQPSIEHSFYMANTWTPVCSY